MLLEPCVPHEVPSAERQGIAVLARWVLAQSSSSSEAVEQGNVQSLVLPLQQIESYSLGFPPAVLLGQLDEDEEMAQLRHELESILRTGMKVY